MFETIESIYTPKPDSPETERKAFLRNDIVKMRRKIEGTSEKEIRAESENEASEYKRADHFIETLIATDPKLVKKLFRKLLWEKNYGNKARATAAKSLAALAIEDPKLAEELYNEVLGKEGRRGPLTGERDFYVKMNAAGSLGELSLVDEKVFLRVYKIAASHDLGFVREDAQKSLPFFASINPEEARKLYEQGLESKDPNLYKGTMESLVGLSRIDPELASKLRKEHEIEEPNPEENKIEEGKEKEV